MAPSAPSPTGRHPPAHAPEQVAHASARGHHLADGGDVLRDQVPAPEGDDPGDHQRDEDGPRRPGGRVDVHLPPHRHRGHAARRRAEPRRTAPRRDPTQGQARTDQPAHLVAPDLAVADRPEPVHLAPGRQQRPDVPQVPRPRAERRPGPGGTAGDHRAHRLDHGQDEGLGDDREQGRGPVRAEQHPDPMARGQAEGRGAAVGPAGERLGVAHPGRRGDEHLGPRHPRPPREAEVVTEERDRLVEPADLGEARRPHQRERARHREHVTEAVVLALVELAPLDERQGDADLVDGQAELGEAPRGVPLHELRAHDVGVPLVGGGHEGADRTGIGGGVVVGEDEELRAGHEVQDARWRPRRSPGPRRPAAPAPPAARRGRARWDRRTPCRSRGRRGSGSPGRRARGAPGRIGRRARRA